MRGIFIFVRFITVALMVLPCCSAVFAQEKTDLGGNKDTSLTGLTGAGAGSSNGRKIRRSGWPRENLARWKPPSALPATCQRRSGDRLRRRPCNQTLTIQPDGYVMLKGAGMVEVQGLNMEELSQAVQKAYGGYLHDPQVAVVLKEFERPYFIVGGEVGEPGKYELRSDTTVAEAVQIAGGHRRDRGPGTESGLELEIEHRHTVTITPRQPSSRSSNPPSAFPLVVPLATICAQGERFQSLFITINCLSRNRLGLWQPS
jgi:hypothetical protein